MNWSYLGRLRSKYGGNTADPDPMGTLSRRYREYRATNLVDCAAVATALSVDDLVHAKSDSLVRSAMKIASPNFDPHAIHSHAEWMGELNLVKGKYFELLVADRLNHGLAVGDVVLPHGYHAVLADSVTQPGWDLRIVDPNGHTSEYLQLKATDSISYVHHAIERYPDIKILATNEVALHSGHVVLDSSITDQSISSAVEHGLNVHHGLLDGFWDHFHPVIPMMLIASMSGYKVLIGKDSFLNGAKVAFQRGKRAMVTTSAAALVKWAGGGVLAIPAALIAGYWWTAQLRLSEIGEQQRRRTRKLAMMQLHYPLLAAPK